MKATQSGIKRFFLQHKRSYIILFFVFLTGMIFAILSKGKEIPEEEIKIYMQDFLSGVRSTGTDSGEIFKLAMQNNIRFLFYMLLASATVIGVPLVWGFVLWKGFSYGMVISGLIHAIGMKTIGVCFSVLLPHILFILPAYLLLMDFAVTNAYHLFLGERDYKSMILKTCGLSFVFLVLSCMSAWVQAYGEPLLVPWISNFTI